MWNGYKKLVNFTLETCPETFGHLFFFVDVVRKQKQTVQTENHFQSNHQTSAPHQRTSNTVNIENRPENVLASYDPC